MFEHLSPGCNHLWLELYCKQGADWRTKALILADSQLNPPANMRKQAEKYNTKFLPAADITALKLSDDNKWMEIDGRDRYTSEFVILATGSSPRLLNIPGERQYKGSGISYCATCDAEFYKDKDIIVVGGGNSAMEEALLLLQFVKSITFIHQFDMLQAEKTTADKVTVNLKTKERIKLERDGVFVFVGLIPNSSFLKETPIELSESGYIVTNAQMETNVKGVYAAGDVRDKKHRQITTAVGEGTVAALKIIHKI
jgi:thioredoxin reductase (NADPH)